MTETNTADNITENTMSTQRDTEWSYEAVHREDSDGAGTHYHVMVGERHICQTATEADARLIVKAVNQWKSSRAALVRTFKLIQETAHD